MKHFYKLPIPSIRSLGNKLIAETDASGNIVNEFAWDAKGRPITWTRNGTIYYYQLNAHNDVIAVTDATGATVASYNYDAYGNTLTQSGTLATANPLRYSSYYFDQATGLYYLTNRYYDPSIGRFLSKDKWLGSDQEPDTLNPYTYAYGNPVIYSDPDGHIANFLIGAAIGGSLAYAVYWLEWKFRIRNWNNLHLFAIVGTAAALGAINGGLSGFWKFSGLLQKAISQGLLTAPQVGRIKKFLFVRNFILNSAVKIPTKQGSETWGSWAKR